jgi:serine phosphatase RsbU (regulator of sigma subunit)
MTAWSNWECLAPAAPWIGAACLLLAGLLAMAVVWARWQPVPGDEDHGMPLPWRYGPAVALGSGCAVVVWLATPELELEIRAIAAAATLFAVTWLFAAWLGRIGDRAVRLMLETAFWKLNAEGIAAHLRRLFQKDEMLGYAAKTIMTELDATSVRLFLLDKGRFELAYSLPSPPPKPESFEQQCVFAQAFCQARREPFLEIVNPATGLAGNWAEQLNHVDAQDLQAEQRRLESLEVEAGIALWHESKLAGFFLIGGRLTNHPFSVAQRLFTAEVASEVSRMLDVLEAAEKMARERTEAERAKADREMAASVRRLMAPPDMAAVAGLEYGVSVETVTGSRAGFCDAVVLPGSALGIVMAETSTGGLQIAVEMVRLQTLLRSRFYVYGEDLREMLDSVERALLATDGARQPIRILLGRYDAIERRLVYVNAGYLPPIWLKNRSDGSETRRLAATGRPLTGEGPADWKVQEIELRRRDLFLAISPGLLHPPDALEKWGENRLLETMLDLEKHPAPAIAHRLVREAAGYEDDSQAKSERSVIVLRPSEAAGRPLMMPPNGELGSDSE